MTKLKPCPFCGGKSDGPGQVEYGECNPVVCWWIECHDCQAYMEMDTKEEVVSAWNKRVATGGKVENVDDTETETVHRFIGE